jgi:hypothetical protein
MLLEYLSSDEQGHWFGELEDGTVIPISSIPSPRTAIGKSRHTSTMDIIIEGVKTRLIEKARTDSGKYYFIPQNNIQKGTQTDKRVYAIPYITFEK